MSNENLKIYVKKTKRIKGVPTQILEPVKVKGSLNDKIDFLIKKQTPYFEIRESETTTIFKKEGWQKNYSKSIIKV